MAKILRYVLSLVKTIVHSRSDIFHASVPAERTAAGSGQDAFLTLVMSIIECDGFFSTS